MRKVTYLVCLAMALFPENLTHSHDHVIASALSNYHSEPEKAYSAAEPSLRVIHDTDRQATCWILLDVAGDPRGLSCLRDVDGTVSDGGT